jgi:large subunit ribosomal protein L19
MSELLKKINDGQKRAFVPVRTGDTVKVYQKIKEGDKERVQMFQGTVIKTAKDNSHTASFTVRKIASGIGVEKSFLLHSPLITKIEITARGKVRRNFLTYMRNRSGKSTRLSSQRFDRIAANELVGGAETPAETEQPTEKLDAADQAAEAVMEAEEKTPETTAEKADVKEDATESAE